MHGLHGPDVMNLCGSYMHACMAAMGHLDRREQEEVCTEPDHQLRVLRLQQKPSASGVSETGAVAKALAARCVDKRGKEVRLWHLTLSGQCSASSCSRPASFRACHCCVAWERVSRHIVAPEDDFASQHSTRTHETRRSKEMA